MGFAINATAISGSIIGAAWAVDPDLGAAATGGVGALYACAVSTYGVFGLLGLASNSIFPEEKEKTSQQLASSMRKIAAQTDREVQQMQELARVRGRLKGPRE